jgi:hypothetical protein
MGLRMAAHPLEGGRYFVLWPVDTPLASCGQRFVVDAYSQGALFLLDEVLFSTSWHFSQLLRTFAVTMMPFPFCLAVTVAESKGQRSEILGIRTSLLSLWRACACMCHLCTYMSIRSVVKTTLVMTSSSMVHKLSTTSKQGMKPHLSLLEEHK